MDIKDDALRGILTSLVIIGSATLFGFIGIALGAYPLTAPLGAFFSFSTGAVVLFPWEFASRFLGVCKTCDSETAVFMLLIVSYAISFVFYACFARVFARLRQCIIISNKEKNRIEYGIIHKKAALLFCLILCAMIILFIGGTYLNLQSISP